LNPKFGMGLAPAQAFACEGRRRRGGAPRAVPRKRLFENFRGKILAARREERRERVDGTWRGGAVRMRRERVSFITWVATRLNAAGLSWAFFCGVDC